MNEKHIPFLQRVELQNYKSIRECDVSLGPLMLLVGPNGAGKSNFLDALRFVADSLRGSMEEALRERGGFKNVCMRSQLTSSPAFKIDLRLIMPDGGDAMYSLQVAEDYRKSKLAIEEEHCEVCDNQGVHVAGYHVKNGLVDSTDFQNMPSVSIDRPYLTIASGFPELRPLYDLLTRMRFYNINPQQIKESTLHLGNAQILDGDGGAAGDVLSRLGTSLAKKRIDEYMHAILPMLDRIVVESLAEMIKRLHPGYTTPADFSDRRFLSFVLHGIDEQDYFSADCMSDGTLRAFGVLLALFQCLGRPAEYAIPVVGIEEPESTLHPGAAGALFDALQEASHFTQVLVTTHSAELLSIKDIDTDSLLAVDIVDGETIIGPVDDASLTAIQDRMYTAGELLEMGQLKPNPKPSAEVKV